VAVLPAGALSMVQRKEMDASPSGSVAVPAS
jgi:hypothetical protein